MELALKEHEGSRTLHVLTSLVLALAMCLVGEAIGLTVISTWNQSSAGQRLPLDESPGAVGFEFAVVLAGFVVHRRNVAWLRRAILVRLRTKACSTCGYSLRGLNVVEGAIVCPECGEAFNLAQRRLTRESTLAAAPGDDLA